MSTSDFLLCLKALLYLLNQQMFIRSHTTISSPVTPSPKTCFNGTTPVLTFILDQGFGLMITTVWKNRPVTSFGHFSCKERMVYISAEKTPDGIAKVIYTSKDDKSSQIFDTLDWLVVFKSSIIFMPNDVTTFKNRALESARHDFRYIVD